METPAPDDASRGASLRKGKSLMIDEEEMELGVPINVTYYPQSVCISVWYSEREVYVFREKLGLARNTYILCTHLQSGQKQSNVVWNLQMLLGRTQHLVFKMDLYSEGMWTAIEEDAIHLWPLTLAYKTNPAHADFLHGYTNSKMLTQVWTQCYNSTYTYM